MADDESPPLREYVGHIWIDAKSSPPRSWPPEAPPIPLRLLATSSRDARFRVVEEYGEGHVISVWNEEDAARPR